MAIVQSDFPSLTDDIQSWFNEAASVAVGEMVGDSLFEVRETKRRTHDHLVLHGFAGVEEVTPGQDLPRVTSEEGKTVALYKSSLINGESPERATLTKQGILSPMQVQRLSERTYTLKWVDEAIV